MDQLFSIISDEALPRTHPGTGGEFAGMVVQIEAREFHANQLIEELRATPAGDGTTGAEARTSTCGKS